MSRALCGIFHYCHYYYYSYYYYCCYYLSFSVSDFIFLCEHHDLHRRRHRHHLSNTISFVDSTAHQKENSVYYNAPSRNTGSAVWSNEIHSIQAKTKTIGLCTFGVVLWLRCGRLCNSGSRFTVTRYWMRNDDKRGHEFTQLVCSLKQNDMFCDCDSVENDIHRTYTSHIHAHTHTYIDCNTIFTFLRLLHWHSNGAAFVQLQEIYDFMIFRGSEAKYLFKFNTECRICSSFICMWMRIRNGGDIASLCHRPLCNNNNNDKFLLQGARNVHTEGASAFHITIMMFPMHWEQWTVQIIIWMLHSDRPSNSW